MVTTRSLLVHIITLLMTVATGSAALGLDAFDFSGHSRIVMGAPDEVASVMDVYGIMTIPAGVDLPLPLDLQNYEYTVHISHMVVAAHNNEPPTVLNILYNGGEIRLFKDHRLSGTIADFTEPSTISDGEVILRATVQNGWTALLFDFDIDLLFRGNGSGFCDFNGGSQLGDLVNTGYYLEDWGFQATTVADADPDQGLMVPVGYHRVFDIQLTPPNDPTASDPATWGQIKTLYH
jgi:hypothetical protein